VSFHRSGDIPVLPTNSIRTRGDPRWDAFDGLPDWQRSSVEPEVLGSVDDAHAAFTEFLEDLVVGNRLTDECSNDSSFKRGARQVSSERSDSQPRDRNGKGGLQNQQGPQRVISVTPAERADGAPQNPADTEISIVPPTPKAESQDCRGKRCRWLGNSRGNSPRGCQMYRDAG
jgi:hypothetical protein